MNKNKNLLLILNFTISPANSPRLKNVKFVKEASEMEEVFGAHSDVLCHYSWCVPVPVKLPGAAGLRDRILGFRLPCSSDDQTQTHGAKRASSLARDRLGAPSSLMQVGWGLLIFKPCAHLAFLVTGDGCIAGGRLRARAADARQGERGRGRHG